MYCKKSCSTPIKLVIVKRGAIIDVLAGSYIKARVGADVVVVRSTEVEVLVLALYLCMLTSIVTSDLSTHSTRIEGPLNYIGIVVRGG